MQNLRRIIVAITLAVVFFVGIGFLPNGGIFYPMSLGVMLILSLISGTRLTLSARAFITAQIFCWTFMLCLLGRTVEPGITRGNIGMMLLYFGIYGFAPGLCLLRLWRLKLGAIF